MTNDISINNQVIAKKKKYKEELLSIRNLPSIPSIMIEISRALDNPMTNANELANLIRRDQGLVAKILTIANSPLYGIPRKVATIEFAIVILGFDHIKNIIIALSMFEVFKGSNDNYWDKNSYWLHSLITATMAKRIADDLGYSRTGEAFTAGLLHDLGIAVLQRYFNRQFLEICQFVEEKQIRHLNAEEWIIGITHQEIGQILTSKWNLPDSLSETILFHHKPSMATNNKELAAIIHLADYLTQFYQVGNFGWDENMEFDEEVVKILQFSDRESLDMFMENYKDSLVNQLESIKV